MSNASTPPSLFTRQVAVLPGDGIGPEVIDVATTVLERVCARFELDVTIHTGRIGAAALQHDADPLPDETLALVDRCDAVLLGAVGHPRYADAPRRPEDGLLELRRHLGVFANLRPVRVDRPELGPLRAAVSQGVDLVFVRELTGGIYFGRPRARVPGSDDGSTAAHALDTMMYSETEVERVARVAFELARCRRGEVCSIDKANVLESSRLWRETVTRVARDYPGLTLRHLLVDAAAMHLLTNPRSFDVVLTGNLFGDILSDEASVLPGSIGLAPSASLGAVRADGSRPALYEPIHGSAPDLAGRGVANPLGAVGCIAMMLRHSFGRDDAADAVDAAIRAVVMHGPWTADLLNEHDRPSAASTHQVAEAVIAAFDEPSNIQRGPFGR